jgi:hypothetical protein
MRALAGYDLIVNRTSESVVTEIDYLNLALLAAGVAMLAAAALGLLSYFAPGRRD